MTYRVAQVLEHAAQRVDESVHDAARRVAIDAVYAARDDGGTMHTAGEAAADAVLLIVNAALPKAVKIPMDGRLASDEEGK
jgi:hypothetical protein